MVRIALIGCGRIAQVAHLPALEEAQGIDLVAVSDPSQDVAEAVARRYGVPDATAMSPRSGTTPPSKPSSSLLRIASITT